MRPAREDAAVGLGTTLDFEQKKKSTDGIYLRRELYGELLAFQRRGCSGCGSRWGAVCGRRRAMAGRL